MIRINSFCNLEILFKLLKKSIIIYEQVSIIKILELSYEKLIKR